jgi:hypothetical protein
MTWMGHVACMDEMRNAYRILVRKPEGQGQLGKHSHSWEDNIQMDLKEAECEDVDWIHLAQDRDEWCAPVKMVMKFCAPKKEVENFVSNFVTTSFSSVDCNMELANESLRLHLLLFITVY